MRSAAFTCAFLCISALLVGGASAQTPQPEVADVPTTDPRGEERTLASFPEWYIVYNAEEYADFVREGGRPSQFPFFASIRQYWDSVRYASGALGEREIDANTRTVLQFIGVSFTLENAVIGAYESTMGRFTEALNFYQKSTVDAYIDGIAKEYGDFLLHTPWYAFPYFEKMPGLWAAAGSDPSSIRAIERGMAFTAGYALKGFYGRLIGALSNSSLGTAELSTDFSIANVPEATLRSMENVEIVDVFDDGHILARAPRYRAFKPVAEAIARAGGTFENIENHDEILLTVVAPADTDCIAPAETAFAMPILTDTASSRFALLTEVRSLTDLILRIESCGLEVEHVYDY